MTRDRATQGFTLVEVMVIVVIIGILVGIAVASYSVAVARAQATTCAATRNALNRSVELYLSEHGHYPADINDLAELVVNWDKTRRCPSGPLLEYSAVTHEVTCPVHSP